MLQTFFSALPVFAIIAAGYAVAKIGVISPDAANDLNRFVVWLALPCLMFSIMATTDWVAIWGTDFIIASVGGSLAIFAIGMTIGHFRGLPVPDIAIDGLNASYSNAAYMGLPLLLLVIGPASQPYVMLSATATLMMLFVLAVSMIELGHNRHAGVGGAMVKSVVSLVRNPIIIGPILGLAWWTTGLPLPQPVDTTTRLLGAAASPTALVAIGLLLARLPLRAALADRSILMLTTAKLAVHPALTAILAYPLLGMSGVAPLTAVAVAALPTGTGPFMVAGLYARDGRVTSGAIALSTVLSVFTVALTIYLLNG